jgi:protein-S-isoprenylcysteine O-methyltransferase Ste14
VAVMLGIYLRAARQEEEKFLRSPLADEYRRYRSSTGLLFPAIGKLLEAPVKTVS